MSSDVLVPICSKNPMRLRFTFRGLLRLTVVVALAVGWWLDHVSTVKLRVENKWLRISGREWSAA